MSEYWKSTPKYWCKHCKTFVRDTKLEKTNHEATPKHQGNIKRFLRDLHRGHEREERDKQRAKNEVERLNGIVSGVSSATQCAPWARKTAIPPAGDGLKQATPAERKKQLAQLAEMGVVIPEEFRKEMAMAGDWETISENPIYEMPKKEEDSSDANKPNGLNIGVRKRKYEGQEDDEAGDMFARRTWGSTTRTYPREEEEDLNSLIGKTVVHRTNHIKSEDDHLYEPDQKASATNQMNTKNTVTQSNHGLPAIKNEDLEDEGVFPLPDIGARDLDIAPIKQEPSAPESEVLFKKRKAKPIRHK